MAIKFQFKRGLKSKLPTLAEGEPGFTTDEKKVYVGTASGNIALAVDGHTHTPAQAGAAPASHAHTAAQTGAVPVTGGSMTGNLTMYGTAINLTPGIRGGVRMTGYHDAASVACLKLVDFEAYAKPVRLSSIADPVNADEAVNKGYMDRHTHTAGQLGALPSGGGTMAGDIVMNNNDILDIGKLRFLYGGDEGDPRLEVVGSNGLMGFKKNNGDPVQLRGIAAPAAGDYAANKQYVDDKIKYGTSNPGAGSSLATGAMFLVYE